MDHHFRIGAQGIIRDASLDDKSTFGRRPTGFYIPRFRNLFGDRRDYLRGFGYQGGASRQGWERAVRELGVGAEFKDRMAEPGDWWIGATGFGEMLPVHDNKIGIDHSRQDKWGLPVLKVDCALGENERLMRIDMANDMAEMLEAAGASDVGLYEREYYPGMGIHEMGTARMGRDPKTSVLNRWNQVWGRPQRVRHRRRLHDVRELRESLVDLYGDHRQGGGPRGQGTQARQSHVNSLLTRREAILRVSAMLGGAALVGQTAMLAACSPDGAKTQTPEADADEALFTDSDLALLDEIAETMLPETSTPGAKAADVGAFMALMVKDAYYPADQAIFREGMAAADARCREAYGRNFLAASPADRLELLEALDAEQFEQMRNQPPDAPRHFFRMMKELALLGYFTSEIGYTQAMRYAETPGRFDPCAPYAPGETAWAHPGF